MITMHARPRQTDSQTDGQTDEHHGNRSGARFVHRALKLMKTTEYRLYVERENRGYTIPHDS